MTNDNEHQDQPNKKYTIDISGLYAVMVVEGINEEDALYACSEGWGNLEILWDDAEYSVRDEETS